MTETKYCPRCEQDLPVELWLPNKARSDGLHSYCRGCHNKICQAGARKRRHELIVELGGSCIRCGFSDERALQVDHVRGGGRKELAGKNSTTASYYKKVLANPKDYQLLCCNCNWIKREENRELLDNRVYSRQIPTADRERATVGKHSSETNARRRDSVKRWYEDHPEDREKCKERSESRRGSDGTYI